MCLLTLDHLCLSMAGQVEEWIVKFRQIPLPSLVPGIVYVLSQTPAVSTAAGGGLSVWKG